MRRVTLVTLVWLACLVAAPAFFYIGRWIESADPGNFLGPWFVLVGMAAALPAVLGLAAVPLLWIYRFLWWVTRPGPPPPPRVGYTAPPSEPEPTPQYTITGRRIR